MIIGITGKIGSGKSTLATYLTTHYGFTEYTLAGPLKQIGEIFRFSKQALYGSQEDKRQIDQYWGISAREFLQKVGTDLFRQELPKIIPDMKLNGSIWLELFKRV